MNKEVKTYTCECGKTVRTASKSVHLKTKFHKEYLNPKRNNDKKVEVKEGDYVVSFS